MTYELYSAPYFRAVVTYHSINAPFVIALGQNLSYYKSFTYPLTKTKLIRIYCQYLS